MQVTGKTYIQCWSSFCLINCDSKRLIQSSPCVLATLHIHVDKFHSSFEFLSGHIILPIYWTESMVFREGKPVQDVQGASWLLSVRFFILSYVFPSCDIIHAMLHIV